MSHPKVACGNACRSAAAAGKVWMMSPMAERRTISRLSNFAVGRGRGLASIICVAIRFSGALAIARNHSQFPPQTGTRTNDLSDGVILYITHDHHSASTSYHLVVLRDTLRRIVRSLGMKVRADFADNCAHVILGKNNNRIHIRQRRQNFCALFGGHNRAPDALQCTHRIVAVERNHQLTAEFAGGMKIAHMADMEQVETSIGQSDAITGAPPFLHPPEKFVARNNLRMKCCAQGTSIIKMVLRVGMQLRISYGAWRQDAASYQGIALAMPKVPSQHAPLGAGIETNPRDQPPFYLYPAHRAIP